MSAQDDSKRDAGEVFTELLRIQTDTARQWVDGLTGQLDVAPPADGAGDLPAGQWGEAAAALQQMWLEFHRQQTLPDPPMPLFADPAQWLNTVQSWCSRMPFLDPDRQQRIMQEGMALWQDILDRFSGAPEGEATPAGEVPAPPELPRADRRFAAPEWRQHPVFALIHQTYLLLAERIAEAIDDIDDLGEREREQLRFATRNVLDAMSPANFPLTNPVVLERTLETNGQNLARGMERLAADLRRGQLTHTDGAAFRLGETIACSPGFVVHETDLYQLIQYSPTTDEVLATPLLIFPPWINRFYILDLNPAKSFVRWAVEQGITLFMVSWRSADESMADVQWDDYIRAQIEAIGLVRERLGVPSVHTIGYCVAGTTLAATLAILARRGEAAQVASATFLTAQVDFERAGDLRLYIDDMQLELVRQASRGGYLDGRYLAAAFNLLRGPDLIWNYVVNHYLLGEDYPAFDLLHWNSDVSNLPARWHQDYLRDLYRDNRLVVPDSLVADGTPIDLRRIETPLYIQAGREDHIAPAESVIRLLDHVACAARFVLAGSGHIAGVVNPPDAGKYQYWTGPTTGSDLEAFLATASETRGSWWGDWAAWIAALDDRRVPVEGRRAPGGEGDTVIEPAPGRYVAMR